MADVSAGVEYKINVDGNSFLLDSKKYQLLESILDTGSLTEAAKYINVSYSGSNCKFGSGIKSAFKIVDIEDGSGTQVKFGETLCRFTDDGFGSGRAEGDFSSGKTAFCQKFAHLQSGVQIVENEDGNDFNL